MSVELLAARQNPDGGWPYLRGVSWTEPTVYAVLALLDSGETVAAERGLQWLRAARRADGGWPPQLGVDEGCWVAALVALLPADRLGEEHHRHAVDWLSGTTGEESTGLARFRDWLRGSRPSAQGENSGWPWVPGTAAWVAPTSFAVLALSKANRRQAQPALERRVEAGRQFLLGHMCDGGGWNHGSIKALGYPSEPYPETTGLALAALRGVRSPQVDTSLPLACRFLAECRSADAWNWLRLGLLLQGKLPAGATPSTPLQRRTVPELALDMMITAAAAGRSGFWD